MRQQSVPHKILAKESKPLLHSKITTAAEEMTLLMPGFVESRLESRQKLSLGYSLQKYRKSDRCKHYAPSQTIWVA